MALSASIKDNGLKMKRNLGLPFRNAMGLTPNVADEDFRTNQSATYKRIRLLNRKTTRELDNDLLRVPGPL